MPITRDRVMLRGRYGWARGTVPFDATKTHQPSGYRQDAAGYICMAWDIPLDAPHSWGGLTTITLDSDKWAYEIEPKDMKPGDALGLLGPWSVGTEGGVIVLFESWLHDDVTTNYVITLEHLPEYTPGPIRRQRVYDRNTWHSYRFRDIVD